MKCISALLFHSFKGIQKYNAASFSLNFDTPHSILLLFRKKSASFSEKKCFFFPCFF